MRDEFLAEIKSWNWPAILREAGWLGIGYIGQERTMGPDPKFVGRHLANAEAVHTWRCALDDVAAEHGGIVVYADDGEVLFRPPQIEEISGDFLPMDWAA